MAMPFFYIHWPNYIYIHKAHYGDPMFKYQALSHFFCMYFLPFLLPVTLFKADFDPSRGAKLVNAFLDAIKTRNTALRMFPKPKTITGKLRF